MGGTSVLWRAWGLGFDGGWGDMGFSKAMDQECCSAQKGTGGSWKSEVLAEEEAHGLTH